MTEQEFYQLKPGDLVEYNGDEFEFIRCVPNLINPYHPARFFKNDNSVLAIFKSKGLWVNTITLDEYSVDNLKLIKKNSTIDEKISETKSQIEKLQNQLKELESEKNSKKIEQLISEMVPGKFYTIKYSNYFHPNGIIKTGKFLRSSQDFNDFIFEPHATQIPIKSIKDIIPREDLTNDYNKFMEKIKKYNQGEI